ncbi:MAG: hypothetical protein M1823_005692 [Watsoniomyces obsoletus]|nr:MAG: hypothetical protein M1823_005692 [Watsoniomyces obsoletus]
MSQRRYRRPGSPVGSNRSLVTPLRSSTGTLGYPPFDPYYPPSRIARDVRPSPRSSSDRFAEPQGPSASRAYPPDLPPPPQYPPAYQRPRRATLDRELQPRRPIITTGQPPSAHGARLDEFNGALVRTIESDADEDYYLAPGTSSRRQQRNASADERDLDPGYPRRARGDPNQGRLVESGGYVGPAGHARRQVYQYPAPDVRAGDEDPRYRYDYEGYRGAPRSRPARDGAYVEPPRRNRADSLDTSRRPRPLSMVELGEHLPRVSGARDAGPPPTTRGFDRLPPPSAVVTSPTTYEPPRSQREADFSRDDRRHGRGHPVLVHQGHADSHGRPRGDRDGYRSDDDRGHRSHHSHHRHSAEVDPRVAVAAAAAAAAAPQRSHRTRDSSPDDLPDGESTDGEARRRRHHHHHHSERRSGRRHRHHDATESDSDSTAQTRESRESRDDDRRRRRHRDRDRTGHESSRRGHTLPTPAELRAQEEHRHRAEPAALVAHGAMALGVNDAEHRSRRDEPRDEGRDSEHDKRDRRRSRRHEVESSDDDGDDDHKEERRSQRASRRRARDEPEMVRTGDVVDLRDRNGAGDDTPRVSHGSEVRVVSPPRSKESKGPLKGILREPRERFPEDPAPVREGVAPLKEALKDGRKGIPPGARWTKIDRRRVNPAALEEAKERFEERPDHVIVLRVLTREEIEGLAARTQKIRGMCSKVDLEDIRPPIMTKLISVAMVLDARERRGSRRTSKDEEKRENGSHDRDRRDSGSSSATGGPPSDSDKDIIYEKEAVPTQTPE